MIRPQLALLGLFAAACATPVPPAPALPTPDPTTRTDDPDPSLRFVLGEDPRFVPNPGLAAPGLVCVYDVADAPTRISLSFVARSAAPEHRDLDAYVAHARAEFEAVVRDREITPLELAGERNPLRAAGLPFRALSFVTVQKPGGPPPTSICDAAGLYVETRGGYWTFSWNADRGAIVAATQVFQDFLGKLEVQRKG